MKNLILTTILLLTVCPQVGHAQLFKKLKLFGKEPEVDVIMKRDGSEINAKVSLLTDEYTYYQPVSSKEGNEMVEANKDIYMIKFYERGNMFFGQFGGLFFDNNDNGDISDETTLIYLLKGEEVLGYNVSRGLHEIRYSSSKKSTDIHTIPVNEVFLIKYPNMPIEIVNGFSLPEPVVTLPSTQPKDEFVEHYEAQPAQEYVIKTDKNVTIQANVIYRNDSFVSYYKKDAPQGPLYRMSTSVIKSIKKVPARRPRKRGQ